MRSLLTVYLSFLQTYTALADTPGNKFNAECEKLLAAGEYSKLLEQFIGQIDVVFNKVSDKGAASIYRMITLQMHRNRRAISCVSKPTVVICSGLGVLFGHYRAHCPTHTGD